MAASSSYHGIYVTRFFLGLFEVISLVNPDSPALTMYRPVVFPSSRLSLLSGTDDQSSQSESPLGTVPTVSPPLSPVSWRLDS
jgi:hypothetical protein